MKTPDHKKVVVYVRASEARALLAAGVADPAAWVRARVRIALQEFLQAQSEERQ